MTLTTRLSLFFQTTLAFVLIGFSVVLYEQVREYLHRQIEARLEATLDTLAAAVEIGPTHLEWEGDERRLQVGTGPLGEPTTWMAIDGSEHFIAGDEGARGELTLAADALRVSERTVKKLVWHGERRAYALRTIRPANADASHGITIIVGMSLEPTRGAIRELIAVLSASSVVIWIAALILGRFICRRALRPVSALAIAVQEMNADDRSVRLTPRDASDELAALTQSFNDLLDRVEESFERQRRFTGDASHQLRTPLTVILGQIEVALRRDRSEEEYKNVLDKVQRKAESMRRLVESLLFLARADQESLAPEKELVDLKEFLPCFLAERSGHPRSDDVQLKLDTERECRVRVQETLLGESIDILLDNAMKYSTPGTPIILHARREGNDVLLEVEDQGCGIAEEDLPHLFTPFFRSADARRRGIDGMGLGLAIAYRLAGVFGGSLTASGRLGEGSRFTLRIPADCVGETARTTLTSVG